MVANNRAGLIHLRFFLGSPTRQKIMVKPHGETLITIAAQKGLVRRLPKILPPRNIKHSRSTVFLRQDSFIIEHRVNDDSRHMIHKVMSQHSARVSKPLRELGGSRIQKY